MDRRIKDLILQSLTYFASILGILILVLIIGFVFIRGFKVLSFDFIFGQYKSVPTWVNIEEDTTQTFDRPADLEEGSYWSKKWGIGLIETRNRDKKKVTLINYIHEDSPLNKGAIKYTNSDETGRTDTVVTIQTGIELSRYKLDFPRPAGNAGNVIEAIDASDNLFIEVTVPAGGIRGSILTTLMMIGVTLLLALPFGIAIALYLHEYAKKNRVMFIMRSMIDMLTGVPSIVYGIVGVLLFFRVFPLGGQGGGYTILGGALTLVAILLPVVIRATEEALRAVPQELRHASLALGANRTQTIFKIVIPSAVPGILTATLLSIGRIIGESAALILVAGTAVNDSPTLRTGGTTLAVHIWKEMSGEQPNVSVAAAISILIIFIVLLLNILVKISSRYLNKANY
jgi:phosphate transport system permease protein